MNILTASGCGLRFSGVAMLNPFSACTNPGIFISAGKTDKHYPEDTYQNNKYYIKDDSFHESNSILLQSELH
jgi:hypothetical protein